MLLKIIIVILVIWGIWFLLTKTQKSSFDEHYGGGLQACEDACFSSPYYDACMHACLSPEGNSGFSGQGLDEYSLPSIESPIPLEDENLHQLVVTHGNPQYRYDYPGH